MQRTLDYGVVERILKSKAKRALSPRSKGAYRAVVLNQVWTRERDKAKRDT